MTEEIKHLTICVKYGGKEYMITDVTNEDTVAVLRHEIFKQTMVRPDRQKLINLKRKGANAEDTAKIGELDLKVNTKIMLIGSTEEEIFNVRQRPEDLGDVVDDLDDGFDEKDLPISRSPIYLAKVQRRIQEYKIKTLTECREGKKLLVLDIDYTLFDHRTPAENGAELMRPYLHEFLKSAYEDYDIVIWSATGMRWIEEKMRLLGVSTNDHYKIMFYLDASAMISIYTPERGVFDVKPLAVIWGKYPQYNEKNSIMFDDIRRNFLMNPKSGLKIRPFRQAHINRAKDKELLKLSVYLQNIAQNCDDFTKLNHRKWETYKPTE